MRLKILVIKKISNSYPTQSSCSLLAISEQASTPGIFLRCCLYSVTLPPPTFVELFNTDVYMVRKVLGQVLILGVFGTLSGALMVRTFAVYALPDYTFSGNRARYWERCSPLPTPFRCLLG